MLNNKQISTTLQLNACLSETDHLPFLHIIIFNSHPRADQKDFTGVCWVVFTEAPQQRLSALAPGIWTLRAALAAGCCRSDPTAVVGKVRR